MQPILPAVSEQGPLLIGGLWVLSAFRALGEKRHDLSWGAPQNLGRRIWSWGSGTVKAGGVEAKMGRDGRERRALTINVQDPTPTYPKPKGRHRLGSTWGASGSAHMGSY